VASRSGKDAASPEEFPIRCAWCGRIRTSEEWAEVEAASLQITDVLTPTMSHGICPECFGTLMPNDPYPQR
jgi:hypothetical protein